MDAASMQRIERCETEMRRWLPQMRMMASGAKATFGEAGERSLRSQVECMETAIWLCGVVRHISRPCDDPVGEAKALRMAMVEVLGVLGTAKAVGDALVRFAGTGQAPPSGARVCAELFLVDLQKVLDRFGVTEEVLAEARQRARGPADSSERRTSHG